MSKTAPFSMRLPPDLKAELQALAEEDRRSLTNYIEIVLLEHVQQYGTKRAQRKATTR